MIPLFPAKLALVLTLLLPNAGEANDREANLRDQCRQRLAGLYLSIGDRALRAKQTIDGISKKLTVAKKELSKSRIQANQLRQRLRSEPYSLSLKDKETAIDATIRLKESTLKQWQEVLAKSRQEQSLYQQKASAIRKELKKVFDFNRVTKTKRLPLYGESLTYKSPCPKYRDSCPLDEDSARKLLNLTIEPYPVACSRYAGQSGVDG